MDKIPWYNTTICTKLNSQSFEDYFKTGRKDRYEMMYYIGVYDKEHVSMPDDKSSGGVIPIHITSYKEELFSLGHTINFLGNWIQFFEVNYENIITFYKINISELSKKIPKLLHLFKNDGYKTKFQKTTKAVGGEWFIEKMNSRIPPYQEKYIDKKEFKKKSNEKLLGTMIIGMIGGSNCISKY